MQSSHSKDSCPIERIPQTVVLKEATVGGLVLEKKEGKVEMEGTIPKEVKEVKEDRVDLGTTFPMAQTFPMVQTTLTPQTPLPHLHS